MSEEQSARGQRITIELEPNGNIRFEFPSDEILTLGLLELAKARFLSKALARQQEARVVPAAFGLPRM